MIDAGAGALVSARDDGARGRLLPLLVALHGRAGEARSEIDRVRLLFGPGPDIVALQAARPCNPMQSNLRAVAEYAGFSWYLGADPSRPEAASFGDALAQVEAFIGELARPFVLVGDEQGTALALTLAAFVPEGLVGVHATRPVSPSIDGWAPPLERMDRIGVVAIRGEPELARFLSDRGARAETRDPAGLEQWLESLDGETRD